MKAMRDKAQAAQAILSKLKDIDPSNIRQLTISMVMAKGGGSAVEDKDKQMSEEESPDDAMCPECGKSEEECQCKKEESSQEED